MTSGLNFAGTLSELEQLRSSSNPNSLYGCGSTSNLIPKSPTTSTGNSGWPYSTPTRFPAYNSPSNATNNANNLLGGLSNGNNGNQPDSGLNLSHSSLLGLQDNHDNGLSQTNRLPAITPPGSGHTNNNGSLGLPTLSNAVSSIPPPGGSGLTSHHLLDVLKTCFNYSYK